MKDVLQNVAFSWVLRIKQREKFLDELCLDVRFEDVGLHQVVCDDHMKDLVDALEVWPGRVHHLFLADAVAFVSVELPDAGKRSENVLFDHLHDLVNVWKNYMLHRVQVINHLL